VGCPDDGDRWRNAKSPSKTDEAKLLPSFLDLQRSRQSEEAKKG
jgi:hypothetical protein